MGILEAYTCVILMPVSHLFFAVKMSYLFIFIQYFILYFPSYSYSLFILIPWLFLFIFYSFYPLIKIKDKKKLMINNPRW